MKQIVNNIKYMWNNMWNFDKKSVLIAFLIIPTRILLPIVTGLVVKIMIDSIEAGISELSMIAIIAGISFIIGALTWVEPILKERLGAVSQNLNIKYRLMSFNKMMSMDYERLESVDARKKFEKSKNFTSDREYGNVWFNYEAIGILSSFFGIFTYLFIISSIKPILLIILSISSILLIIATYFHARMEMNVDSRLNDMDLKNNYLFRIATDIPAGKDIRAYSFSSFFQRLINGLKLSYRKTFAYFTRKTFIFILVIVVLSLINESAAFFFLLKDVTNGSMTVANFIFLFGIVTGMWGWIFGIVNQSLSLKKIAVHCQYFRDFIELDDASKTTESCAQISKQNLQIEFQNVEFTYPEANVATIKNFSFTVKNGEKIAIVGENGAGKTTCIKLLCGLYNASKGKILINGVDISHLDRKEYFKLMSVVFQDHIVLPLSIEKNITLNAETDRVRLDDVIEKSGLKEVLDRLEKGAETTLIKKINDGAVDLSGGEMQRLLLARALYKNAPILILDEPTAALDPIAETNLYNRYNELTKDKISFFVSHRLSSTRFCDRIFFISDGQIIESGSHEELIKQQGAYAKMFDVQSYYYKASNNINVGGAENE